MAWMTRLYHRVADQSEPSNPLEKGVQQALAVLAPFYGLGASVNRMRYESGLARRERLSVPVLSIGNITLGGTGKTPFVAWIAEELKRQGKQPAVLTRGYGRQGGEDRLVVVHDGKGLRATAEEGGDEPVLLARQLGDVPVVACADRCRAGRLATRRLGADVLILDDGFQHFPLERDGEIVLIDASRPLGGLRLFPRGSLREPVGALSRAHLIVLTRTEQAKDTDAITKRLRQVAPHVPVVRFPTQLEGVVEPLRGEQVEPGGRAIVACAVGNPKAVVRTARLAGYQVAGLIAAPDHARLGKAQAAAIARLAKRKRADRVVLTEKDATKLEGVTLGGLPVEVLRVAVGPEGAEDLKVVRRVLRARLAGKTRGLLK